MERFMDQRWVMWPSGESVLTPSSRQLVALSFRTDRHSDQGRHWPVPSVRHDPAGFPAAHPLQPHLCRVRLLLPFILQTPIPKTGRILKSSILISHQFLWQARWRWQEPAGDHPQGYPGIRGEDDRHSDRELRREMVGGQWRHQKAAVSAHLFII